MTALPPWDHAEIARKSDVENVKVALEATRVALEAKIDAQFHRLVAFLLPLMIGLVALVLAAAAIA